MREGESLDERLRKELLRSELKERNNGKKIIRCKYRPKYPDSAEREYTQQSVESVDGEELEVTLTNTKDFYFNNSVKTVALANMRSTLDYRVITEVQGNPVNVGDVVVYDKQVNGFKIAFTGSAKSVTVRCFVQGGGTV